MNINKIKRWLNEDKGGFGAFLILVIVGLAFYALQRKDPIPTYDLAQIETERKTPTERVVNRKPFTATTPAEIEAEKTAAQEADSIFAAREKEKEEVKPKAKTPAPKPKAKPKPTRKRISNEDLVRSKLRAGMSVRQIAKATGLEKKYIRDIKKRKECNCP
jgi:pyruvate/2-oxoglutarate dehydrogenase complex dihydrolipoamide acyltransferase (E2) component